MDKAGNRIDQLPVGGKLAHYQNHWKKLFPQHPEIVRYLDCLRRRTSITSSLPAAFAKQRQNCWPLTHCPEASGFSSYGGGNGHYVPGLLQPPVSCSKTRRILPSNHRLEEVKSIPHCSFVQNGVSILNHSSPPTTGMDHKDRPEDACHHILVHVNIRKYFRFIVAGVVYQFRVLLFGLSTAPWE